MSHSLIYPKYMPEARDLRTNLLFHDKTSTIIPQEDSYLIYSLPHVREILENLGEEVLGRFDPIDYLNCWDSDKDAQVECETIIKEVMSEKDYPIIYEMVLSLQNGTSSNQESHTEALLKSEWRYISFQKFPPRLLDMFSSKGLAVRRPTYEYELTPVLTHPKIAKFILMRLARVICERTTRITPVSTESIESGYFIKDSVKSSRQKRSNFLKLSADVIIPSEVEKLDFDMYLNIRNEYKDVRKYLAKFVNEIIVDLEIDAEDEFKEFEKDASEALNELRNLMDEASRSYRNRKKKILTIDFLCQASGAGIGNYLGDIHGAMLGGGVGTLTSRLLTGRLERKVNATNPAIERFASLRNRIRNDAYEPPVQFRYI